MNIFLKLFKVNKNSRREGQRQLRLDALLHDAKNNFAQHRMIGSKYCGCESYKSFNKAYKHISGQDSSFFFSHVALSYNIDMIAAILNLNTNRKRNARIHIQGKKLLAYKKGTIQRLKHK